MKGRSAKKKNKVEIEMGFVGWDISRWERLFKPLWELREEKRNS